MTPDEILKQAKELLEAEIGALLQRIVALEQRRGLSSLEFVMDATWPDDQARLDAMMALVHWRVARLEAFHACN